MQKVSGSIPLFSTKIKEARLVRAFLILASIVGFEVLNLVSAFDYGQDDRYADGRRMRKSRPSYSPPK